MKSMILNEIFRILSLIDEIEASGYDSSALWSWVEVFDRKFEFLC